VREQDDLMRRLRAEAEACYSWSNAAGYRYAAHRHSYRKILYCVSGSIRFDLEEDRRQIEMSAGDRLDLPPGTLHSALVGPAGVTCIEGQGR
jgi:quercetin dioxygenase-like cupin family protein